MAASWPDRPALNSELNPAGATAARDRDLVVRLRTGDEEAFAELYRTYVNGLGAFVKSIVQSDDVAEEIIQDLFLRLWKDRHSWDPPNPLGAYLYRAARNRAISHLRHERIETKFLDFPAGDGETRDIPDVAPIADDLAEAADLNHAIVRVIETLPPRCREVFNLRRSHELSYAEIGEVLGISVKTVEIHMSRALGTLRRQLAPWRPR